jgi:hypothetical protein
MSDSPLVFGIVLLLALGCTGPVHAQGQQLDLLGRHNVGSKLSEVRNLQRSEDCLIDGGHADCTFTDANGVSYVVLEDSVTTVTAAEKTTKLGVKLPFGLKFGDTFDAAVGKLVSGGRTWIFGEANGVPAGVVASSRDKFSGKNGWDFNVEVRFVSGRLVAISYNSGSI